MSPIVFVLNKQKNNCDKGFILLPTFFSRTRSLWLISCMQVNKICYLRSIIAKWGPRYNEGITYGAFHFQLQDIVFNLNWWYFKLNLRFGCISSKIFSEAETSSREGYCVLCSDACFTCAIFLIFSANNYWVRKRGHYSCL